eukprot:TRINITY_DN478_c0_g1_i2.p2 TRINITY_DN478_c0_g1~~TRINITY_DN478_c0_g1_i2.p2  ORF type:complete len:168 (+),score=29.13 TRINITY_DN478_c0_g1_i2:16-519(+)
MYWKQWYQRRVRGFLISPERIYMCWLMMDPIKQQTVCSKDDVVHALSSQKASILVYENREGKLEINVRTKLADDGESLLQCLSSSTCIVCLGLFNCMFSETTTIALASIISRSETLERLYLYSNCFLNDGASKIRGTERVRDAVLVCNEKVRGPLGLKNLAFFGPEC